MAAEDVLTLGGGGSKTQLTTVHWTTAVRLCNGMAAEDVSTPGGGGEQDAVDDCTLDDSGTVVQRYGS